MKLKLTPRLALVFIVFAFGILVGVGRLVYHNGRNALQAATITELEATSGEKEAAVTSWITERESKLRVLASSPYILAEFETLLKAGANPSASHERLLRELAVRTGPGQSFLTLLILSPETGEVILSVNPDEMGDLRKDLPYFTEGKKRTYTTPIYFSKDLLTPAMTSATPMYSEEGELLGVLAGRLNLAELNTIVQRRSGLRQTDDAFLVNPSNLFVTQPRFIPDPAILTMGIHTEPVQNCLKGRSGTMTAMDSRGIPVIASYRWLSKHEMCLIVKITEAEALAPVQEFAQEIGWILGGTLLAASLIAFLLSRALLRPIHDMQVAAQRYGNGDLDMRLPETRRDELGVLAHEFNQMAESLAKKERELRDHAQMLEVKVQERTRALMETVSQLQRAEEIGQIGSWELDVSEGRVTLSEGLQKLLKLESESSDNSLEAYFARIHPDDVAQMQEIVQRALQSAGAFDFESRVLQPDGQIRTFYGRGESFFDEQGNPVRLVGISIDITDRKQIEEALRESEEKFKYIFDHSMIGNSITFPDGTINVNKAFCDMLGYSAGELKQKKWQEITHPDDIEVSSLMSATLIAGEKDSVRFRKRYLHKDGSVVWTDLSTALRRDAAGRPLYFFTALLDITEQKQAEEQIFRLSKFPAENPYPVLRVQIDGRVAYANKASRELLEMWSCDIDGYLPTNWKELISQAVEKQSEKAVEVSCQGRVYSITLVPVLDGGYVNLYGSDITERKQAEEALRLSEKRYRSIFNVAPVSIWLEDWKQVIEAVRDLRAQGVSDFRQYYAEHPEFVAEALRQVKILDVNDETLTMFKAKTKQEMLSSLEIVFATDSTLPGFIGELVALGEGQEVYKTEMALCTVQGDLIHALLKMSFPPEGTSSGEVLVSVMDITERKIAEETVRQISDRLLLAARAANVGIWDFNVSTNALLWDEAMFKLYGIEAEQFTGAYDAWRSGVHPDDLARSEEELELALRGEKEFDTEFRVIWPDHSIHFIKANGLVQRDELGNPIRMIGTNWDISESKRTHEALKRYAEELRRSNAELEQFAYVASHDLQEPLRMISSYVQLLAKRYQDKLDSDANEFIGYAVDGAKRMQNLINDLLAYSRVGTRGNEFEPISANELLEESVANLQFAIEENGAKITHEDLPLVKGDRLQLVQVFQNLLGNAIKFRGCEPPCVQIGARLQGNEWLFSVRDNGIGFDSKFADRIFIIFQRLNDRNSYPGTGIGLAICKRIIGRHGGRIWVESEPGQGSTFYFTLPSPDGM